MTDWLTWTLIVLTPALAWLIWWLWREEPPDTIERFKHWRP